MRGPCSSCPVASQVSNTGALSVVTKFRHFFTLRDQEKSKDFYVRILGWKGIKPENPCYIKLANDWNIPNSGRGPAPDKPEVLFETPSDLNRLTSFLNLRVADVWACWGDKGARFLTEPLDNHGLEWRCLIPTATSSTSVNTLKWPSTVSKTTPVKLPSHFTPEDASNSLQPPSKLQHRGTRIQ
jgi:hypothetical protein